MTSLTLANLPLVVSTHRSAPRALIDKRHWIQAVSGARIPSISSLEP